MGVDWQLIALFLLLGSFIMGRIDVTCEPNKALQYVFNFIPAYGIGYGLIRVRRSVPLLQILVA